MYTGNKMIIVDTLKNEVLLNGKKYKTDIFKDYDKIKQEIGIIKIYKGKRIIMVRRNVRIHAGNFIDETKGCILVGRGKQKGAFITDSKTALKILLDNIENEDELIIESTNKI